MSRNATTASSSYSISAAPSRVMMRQNTQSVTAPPRRPAIIPACRAETTHEGAIDGNVSEVQAQDPEERQPREARIHLVPQGMPEPLRPAASRLARTLHVLAGRTTSHAPVLETTRPRRIVWVGQPQMRIPANGV